MTTIQILLEAYRETTQDATAGEAGSRERKILDALASWIDGVAETKHDLVADLRFLRDVLDGAATVAEAARWPD